MSILSDLAQLRLAAYRSTGRAPDRMDVGLEMGRAVARALYPFRPEVDHGLNEADWVAQWLDDAERGLCQIYDMVVVLDRQITIHGIDFEERVKA